MLEAMQRRKQTSYAENRKMNQLLMENARVLTLDAGTDTRDPRRGTQLRELGVIDRGWVMVRDGIIEDLGEGDAPPSDHARLDLEGRVLMPGLVDCHTHACWSGCRFDEFDQKLAGATYL